MKPSGQPVILVLSVASVCAAIWGCERPLHSTGSPDALHRQLVDSVRREIASFESGEMQNQLTRQQQTSRVEEMLRPRLEELNQMAGPSTYRGKSLPPSTDLAGAEQTEVSLALQQSIASAVRNNLSVQIARLQPAITEAEVVAAEARFDATFFTSLGHTRLDEPTTTPILNGIPLGTPLNVRETTALETGIRQPLRSGGQFNVSTRLDRLRNKTPGFSLSPDPAYTSRISVGLSQPLLRGFGSNVNEAQIRLAENDDRRAITQLQSALLDLTEQVENAYWDLVAQRESLLVRQRSLERGIEVRDLLERRQARGDVLQAELADAIATVERRRSDVIRAARAIRAGSDQLKLLMNDPNVTVGSEVLLSPIDVMVEDPMQYNIREALLTAIDNRPEIVQATLALDDAGVQTILADNARLPLLDIAARIEYVGLDDTMRDSYGNVTEDRFVDYFLSLLFEQPIGNRAAEAGFRQARLRQSSAVISYQNTVQQVVFDVKSALRDVVTNYDLIHAARSFRIAQTENMRSFDARDEQDGLNATRLNIKFQRQDGLALAELQEIEALANFNKAIARFYRATGVGLDVNGIEFVVEDREQND